MSYNRSPKKLGSSSPPPDNTPQFRAMFNAMRNMPEKVVLLSQDYHVSPPRNPEDGSWYFATTCHNCGETTPIIEDVFLGEKGNVFRVAVGEDGSIVAPCIECGKVNKSKPVDIRTEQAPFASSTNGAV